MNYAFKMMAVVWTLFTFYEVDNVFAVTKVIGTYGNWSAYNNNEKSCFLSSKPIKRNKLFMKPSLQVEHFFVTNTKKAMNEISIKFSKNSMISIALTLGAPVIDPIGNVDFKTSVKLTSSSISELIEVII